MDINTLEEKLGIANLSDAEKLALVKGIESNVQASKAAVKAQEAGQYASLVVDAIKRIKNDLETRFNELNGIIDVKANSLQDGKDGLQGAKGEKGDRGFDGVNGKDGYNGKDGLDGVDGKDGVGVQDAYIDFDGSLIIKLTDGTEINVGEVVPMDVAEKIKIIGNGGGTSQSVLDSLESLQDQINTLTGIDGELGTMAQQDDTSVDINGGSIDGTTIGATTPAAGTFTTLIGGGGSANYFQTEGAATTKAVEAKALGSDTNIAFVIDSKGTGAIDLAAGSSGVNISNGGTVTALTRTAQGSGYTTLPSVAISAPTTAGGVQATASATITILSYTISAGGSGYTVGNTVTLTGGTFTTPWSGTVATVSAGAITSITTVASGSYTVFPTGPAALSGGTGSGATLSTFSGGITSVITITNAGSGYVEQPTVTFSGGGGSGAAAYATVGSATVIRSLHRQTSVFTAGGETVRISDLGGLNDAFVSLSGSQFQRAYIGADGSATNVALQIGGTKGTGQIVFATGPSGTEQARVAHTASAVNYVQVTGGATTIRPTISAQGSDINLGLSFTTKGTGRYAFFNNNAQSSSQFSVGLSGLTTAVNYLNVNGAAAGSAPAMTAEGSDTNIDLTLTPKGTGNVRFGTYTANMALVVQGYIEIKDSGGTVRKLAVIA